MMTHLNRMALGLTTAALFATSAQATGASDSEAAKENTEAPVSQTVKTIDADGQIGQLTLYRVDVGPRNATVLGAFEDQETDAYIVQDNNGELFINHLVPFEALPNPALKVEVADTYTTEYRGMVFTNTVLVEQ